ncbi:MAG: stage II sporulation protein D [Oscillibacter sp.]|nr:stage II sporulation protein D [Oscillibacter sp.]
MKDFPNQIPSQRVRTIPANPPRRRDITTRADTDTAAPMRRRDTNTAARADSDTPAPARYRDTAARNDSNAAARADTNTPARNDSDTAPARRRTRRRQRRRATLPRSLHTVMTASAGLVVALFLMPFLLTGDNRSNAATLSGMLTEAEAVRTDVEIPLEPEPQPEPMPEPETVPEVFTGQLDEDCMLKVLDKKSGEVSVMSMQEYLVCVLRGEMPGYFELEALKAQAVAARTYTRYMLHSGSKHGDKADICTSPACCQAYLSAAAARKKWGYLPEDEEQKLRAAVEETDGETMLYDGEPILAVFHASSAGLTRTSADVWSGDKPYLQPVSSPENADAVPNYYSHVEMTITAFRDKLQSAFPKANLTGDPYDWLSDVERDSAGSIITMYVGGIKTQGSRVRSALGLRSACFTWEMADGKVSFYVTGYGHGVGLSQYGANQMARDGSGYREILTHYYTGVRIGGYNP